jgi:ABC-type lipoprotein export system ATPase subunit
MRRLEQLEPESDEQPRSLGVSWTDLTVKGISAGATFNENVLSQFNPFHKSAKGNLKTIVESSHGCVKPGEMLLVLGRPGAGCTTLLSVLANNRRGYKQVSGNVKYGNMSFKDAQAYRGQIVMNTEEEVFFPTLSVQNTIDFATRMKSPHHLPPGIQSHEQFAQEYKKFLLESVGISHTAKTKVGDAFIRGVSGGERKRVSILECLTTRGSAVGAGLVVLVVLAQLLVVGDGRVERLASGQRLLELCALLADFGVAEGERATVEVVTPLAGLSSNHGGIFVCVWCVLDVRREQAVFLYHQLSLAPSINSRSHQESLKKVPHNWPVVLPAAALAGSSAK